MKAMLILVSGPYLSGTDGDPDKIAKNLAAMEAMALPIFERGHLALVGEWLAWPVIRAAGGSNHHDCTFIIGVLDRFVIGFLPTLIARAAE